MARWGTIAPKWSKDGHSLRIANSWAPEAVRKHAPDIGTLKDAEVVLLAMHFPTVAMLPHHLFDQPVTIQPSPPHAINGHGVQWLILRIRAKISIRQALNSTMFYASLNWEKPKAHQTDWFCPRR